MANVSHKEKKMWNKLEKKDSMKIEQEGTRESNPISMAATKHTFRQTISLFLNQLLPFTQNVK